MSVVSCCDLGAVTQQNCLIHVSTSSFNGEKAMVMILNQISQGTSLGGDGGSLGTGSS